MQTQTTLRERIADARFARAVAQPERLGPSLAWLVASAATLAEEEVAAADLVGPAYAEAVSANRIADAAVRRHIEAWARSSRDLGDGLEVETRQWCRRTDLSRAQVLAAVYGSQS